MIAGIDRYPLKVTKTMGKKKIARRSKVKAFLKVVNYNHVMPTRYVLQDVSLKNIVGNDALEKGKRDAVKKAIKKAFEERYVTLFILRQLDSTNSQKILSDTTPEKLNGSSQNSDFKLQNKRTTIIQKKNVRFNRFSYSLKKNIGYSQVVLLLVHFVNYIIFW